MTARVNQSAVLVQTKDSRVGRLGFATAPPDVTDARSHSATRLGLFFKHRTETLPADGGMRRTAKTQGLTARPAPARPPRARALVCRLPS